MYVRTLPYMYTILCCPVVNSDVYVDNIYKPTKRIVAGLSQYIGDQKLDGALSCEWRTE